MHADLCRPSTPHHAQVVATSNGQVGGGDSGGDGGGSEVGAAMHFPEKGGESPLQLVSFSPQVTVETASSSQHFENPQREHRLTPSGVGGSAEIGEPAQQSGAANRPQSQVGTKGLTRVSSSGRKRRVHSHG